MELYFDRNNKEYYAKNTSCNYCNKDILSRGFIFSKYSRSKNIGNKTEAVCINCLGKCHEDNLLYDFWEGKQFLVTEKIDSKWIIYYFTPPSFKNSKNDLSVFEAADQQLKDETTIDNTKLSGRNNNKDLLLEKQRKQELLDDRLDKDFLEALNEDYVK